MPLDLPQVLFDRQACDTGAIIGPDPIPHRGSTLRIHEVFQDLLQHRRGKVRVALFGGKTFPILRLARRAASSGRIHGPADRFPVANGHIGSNRVETDPCLLEVIPTDPCCGDHRRCPMYFRPRAMPRYGFRSPREPKVFKTTFDPIFDPPPGSGHALTPDTVSSPLRRFVEGLIGKAARIAKDSLFGGEKGGSQRSG